MLATQFQNLANYVLRFIGFYVETSGDVFLREAADFDERFGKYFDHLYHR